MAMLLSLALILFMGFALGGLLQKMALPPLLGMMVTGAVLGPHVLGLIDGSILSISTELRQIALIVILLRAGLSLDVKDLRRVGRPAVLLCFVPATFEMLAVTLLAPPLLGVTRLDAAIMGAVLAAVSPAVVVPRMLRLMEGGWGQKHRVPQMVMAGASVDDVYVIVLFTAYLGMAGGEGFHAETLLMVPLSIVLGLVLGAGAGLGMAWLFARIHMRDTVKVLLLLGMSFLLVSLEAALKGTVPVSGLLAVMALGGALLRQNAPLAKRIAGKYGKVWVAAELLLFTLVGAAVDVRYLGMAGLAAVALVLGALLFRTAGVLACLAGTRLTRGERAFTAIAYLPKATVQAAIGGIPLAMGMAAGNAILTVAVLAILITAPLGAIGIDRLYARLLTRGEDRGA